MIGTTITTKISSLVGNTILNSQRDDTVGDSIDKIDDEDNDRSSDEDGGTGIDINRSRNGDEVNRNLEISSTDLSNNNTTLIPSINPRTSTPLPIPLTINRSSISGSNSSSDISWYSILHIEDQTFGGDIINNGVFLVNGTEAGGPCFLSTKRKSRARTADIAMQVVLYFTVC